MASKRKSGGRAGPVRDPRLLAFDVLARVEGGAFADVLVGETLERAQLEPRDAALFTRLVYGTVTWRSRLDWTLAGLVRRPLDRLDPAVLIALRLGLFQLFRLDRVPAHAAIDTSVELAKRAAGAAAAGLVNAVLRAAVRQGGERALPAGADDPVRALAIEWSHPEWLVRRWLAELGAERTPRLLAANDQPAPTVLRIDQRVKSRDEAMRELAARGVRARPTAYASAGIEIDGPPPTGVAWLAAQGEAAQLVVDLIAIAPAERVLDLCAAPGGKSAALSERLGAHDTSLVVAADRSRPGMRRTAALAASDPPRRIAPLVADACAPPFADRLFDAVLVDAPCSGLGTLRAHPEIRWRRLPGDVTALAATQRQMLHAAGRLVRPGGRLVYATCTLLTEENEEVVGAFLADQRSFRLEDARRFLSPAAAALVDEAGALKTAPDVGGLDGFFAVRLARDARDPG